MYSSDFSVFVIDIDRYSKIKAIFMKAFLEYLLLLGEDDSAPKFRGLVAYKPVAYKKIKV